MWRTRVKKVALATIDTPSFLEILQAHFGQVGLIDSNNEESVPIKEEEGTSQKTKEIGNLAKAELVFPLKSIPLVTACIPEDLPLCGPEAQSYYQCQAFQCSLDFTQKATVCNHVWHDHLNVALTCLYCSFEENHTAKCCKGILSIYPDEPEFIEKFKPQSGNNASLRSSTKQLLPHEMETMKWVQAAKQFLKNSKLHLLPQFPRKKGWSWVPWSSRPPWSWKKPQVPWKVMWNRD